MSQGKKPQSRGWLKNVLRFIAILLFLFLALTAIGIFATQYLQNVDIRAWFIKTQWIWFPQLAGLVGELGRLHVQRACRAHVGAAAAAGAVELADLDGVARALGQAFLDLSLVKYTTECFQSLWISISSLQRMN